MQTKQIRYELVSNYQLTMVVCLRGKCIGLISSHGVFYVDIVKNPLRGIHADPDLDWFVITWDSPSFRGLRNQLQDIISQAESEDYLQLQIGLPVYHLHRSLSCLREIPEWPKN